MTVKWYVKEPPPKRALEELLESIIEDMKFEEAFNRGYELMKWKHFWKEYKDTFPEDVSKDLKGWNQQGALPIEKGNWSLIPFTFPKHPCDGFPIKEVHVELASLPEKVRKLIEEDYENEKEGDKI